MSNPYAQQLYISQLLGDTIGELQHSSACWNRICRWTRYYWR